MTLNQILAQHGPSGVQDYVEFPDGIGRITDDTQMTLFTAEAMLRTIHRSVQKEFGVHIFQISMAHI